LSEARLPYEGGKRRNTNRYRTIFEKKEILGSRSENWGYNEKKGAKKGGGHKIGESGRASGGGPHPDHERNDSGRIELETVCFKRLYGRRLRRGKGGLLGALNFRI